MRIGILPFGRPTFDVAFAEENLSAMLQVLDACGHQIVGPRTLLMDGDAGSAALAQLQGEDIDQLLVLQVTFTDAGMIADAVAGLDVPISIWAIPEPRIGGRLRLNSFCGLNLASHALGLRKHRFSWLYRDPLKTDQSALSALLGGELAVRNLSLAEPDGTTNAQAQSVVSAVEGKKIACIGQHPDGFDTCAYDPDELKGLSGVTVDALDLDHLFDAARAAPGDAVDDVRKIADETLPDLSQVDQQELDRSLRLKVALDAIRGQGNYDAFALRCWPETFTEYGGAVCGPASMLGENRVPCACEADVYGALTQLILQEVASAPVFLTDLVDMDVEDDTGVVWHCGQAPLSMCDETVQPSATIHTNRKMPLLYEFTLKPGPVTLLRISQSGGKLKMILSAGEMLRRPMAFTGTSGVVRFNRPVEDVLPDIMNSGIEHHLALAYGDHRDQLRSVAAAMALPLLEI